MATPATLDYDARTARRAWGPIAFRPSVRSILLVVATALLVVWVARRHEPWTLVVCQAVDAGNAFRPCRPAAVFVADNLLVTSSSEGSLVLVNPATGRPLRKLLQISKAAVTLKSIRSGTQLMVFDLGAKEGAILDVATGRLVRPVPNLSAMGLYLIGTNDDASRVLTNGRPSRRPSPAAATDPSGSRFDLATDVWDLSCPVPPEHAVPIKRLCEDAHVEFYPQLSRILVEHVAGAHKVEWVDMTTLKPIREIEEPAGTITAWGVVKRYLAYSTGRPAPDGTVGPCVLELRDPDTGRLVKAMPFTDDRRPTVDTRSIELSDDESRVLSVNHRHDRGTDDVHIWDADRGVQLGGYTSEGGPHFARSGHLVRWWRSELERHFMCEDRFDRPIAYLPDLHGTRLFALMIESPDGRFVASAWDELRIAKRTGWDCPQSRWGVLAMPHVWGLIVSATAAALSLALDGRRRGVTPSLPSILNRLLLLLSTATVVFAFLAATTAHPVPWPWPAAGVAALVAAIGLATGSRFWRWGATILLAGVLGAAVLACRAAMRGKLTGSAVDWVLDRRYDVPNAVMLAVPAVGALLAASAVAMIHFGARRRLG